MATSAITPTPRAQLRAEVARALHLGGLVTFPLFVLAMFALPSSGAALGVLAALALGFLGILGGAVYVARRYGLRADHGAPDSPEARLIAVLDDDVTREELPNGAARLALARAIVAGQIVNVYRPHMAPYHVVMLASHASDIETRLTLAEWVAAWRAAALEDGEGMEASGGAPDRRRSKEAAHTTQEGR